GGGRERLAVAPPPGKATPGEHARHDELGEPFGQRHDGGERVRRWPPDEDAHPQRLAPCRRGRVMHADAAMDLVVEPDFAIGDVVVARELHAVHAEVALYDPREIGVIGEHQGSRVYRVAVVVSTLETEKLRGRR